MNPRDLTEYNLTEQPTIDWFKQLDYEYKFGTDISPSGVLVKRESYKNVF